MTPSLITHNCSDRSSGSSWLKVTPFGIRPLLNWVRQKFGNHQILITENGVSDRLGHIDDLHRIYYFKHYINQILKGQFTILLKALS